MVRMARHYIEVRQGITEEGFSGRILLQRTDADAFQQDLKEGTLESYPMELDKKIHWSLFSKS